MKKNEHGWKGDDWKGDNWKGDDWKDDSWMSEEALDMVSGGADKINGGKVKVKADVKLADTILMDKNVNDAASFGTIATIASKKED